MFACFVIPYCTCDTASFCALRNQPVVANAIIEEGRAEGLSRTDYLKRLAEEGQYIPVLKAVWSERDRPRRLEWLRANASLHAPLMFERAIAEFALSPTVQTIHLVSLPLIEAAKLRVQQDCQCSQDPSVYAGDAHELMAHIYLESLERLSLEKLHQSVDRSGSFRGEQAAIVEKKLETMRLSMSTPLPSPEWTKWHSPGALTWNMPMHSPFEWQDRRVEFAQRTTTQIGEMVLPAALLCLLCQTRSPTSS